MAESKSGKRNPPAAGGEQFRSALQQLAVVLQAQDAKRSQIQAGSEEQLKEPVAAVLRGAAAALGHKAETRPEARAEGIGARPDIGVAVNNLLCGYVELKAPGAGSDPRRFKGRHNREQWKRLSALPNLLYSDGHTFCLCRNGEVVRGPRAFSDENALREMLFDFLNWDPMVPTRPRQLAKFLAPICQMIRADVEAALQRRESAISQLAGEWRGSLFPSADDAQFADAYTQTLTYAMLLARLSGADVHSTEAAAIALENDNPLLAQVLRVLGQLEARAEIGLGLDLLTRALSAASPTALRARGNDELWLHFYEGFLAEYDAKLRKKSGAYYTPHQVVNCQVRLVSELLNRRFGKPLAFADEGVTFLDPAAGTGAYLVAAVQHALKLVQRKHGKGAVPERASLLAQNLYGFEFMMGPYAVAHLRLSRELQAAEGVLPGGRPQIYLADTLQSHWTTPPEALTLQHRPLVEEQKLAQRVKAEQTILVCIGNPPYEREQKEFGDESARKGGWVRYGRDEKGLSPEQRRPILEDFLQPVRERGGGVHLVNLYNVYVYFWRWALWKLFESHPNGGIVSFITASSYMTGPGFAGMREIMRQTFDELWLLDLEGGNLGARQTENVFDIQTPVAIAIGVRKGGGDRETPATVRYAKIKGSRRQKFDALNRIVRFTSVNWEMCPKDWHTPFKPESKGDYFRWPALTSLFPWQHTGSKFGRTWPVAETKDVLEERWMEFLGFTNGKRRKEFKETADRNLDSTLKGFDGNSLPPLSKLSNEVNPPEVYPYAHRAFDLQYALLDNRLSDRPRPELLRTLGNDQIFMTSLLTGILGKGPAAVVTNLIPDGHYFRGSFGGKDVIPLYRDSAATQPNVTPELIAALNGELRGESRDAAEISATDLFTYCYALLAAPDYTARFAAELETPGPRIPVTTDLALFRRAERLGRHLIWLHTHGARLAPETGLPGAPRGKRGTPVQGKARCLKAVPGGEDEYPEACNYDSIAREIRIGAGPELTGRFGPVAPEIWEYEVSGYKVVQQWIKRRLRKGAGRRSSKLDEIRPRKWDHRFTDGLLQLLWTLEHTAALAGELNAALDAAATGDCIPATALPAPRDADRRPPRGGLTGRAQRKLRR